MYQYQARENLSIGAKRDLKKPICYENTVCQKEHWDWGLLADIPEFGVKLKSFL